MDFYPVKFSIEAVTISMGIGNENFKPVEDLCMEIDVNLTIEETAIGKIVFEVRQEKNPCSLCSNMKRGAINNVAKRLGCNKVALAHNMDDVIETFLLSLFFEGRIHTFSPVTYLERTGLTVIRPLIYAPEKEIKSFVKKYGIETVPSPCPANGTTKRHYIKELLKELEKDNRKLKGNLFGAIKRATWKGGNTEEVIKCT